MSAAKKRPKAKVKRKKTPARKPAIRRKSKPLRKRAAARRPAVRRAAPRKRPAARPAPRPRPATPPAIARGPLAGEERGGLLTPHYGDLFGAAVEIEARRPRLRRPNPILRPTR